MKMITRLRHIGNSRGVIIPAPVLAQIGYEDQLELRVEDGKILLIPLGSQKRQGWFDGYQADQDDDAWQGYVADAKEDQEWDW
jgi:antitoxin MazE